MGVALDCERFAQPSTVGAARTAGTSARNSRRPKGVDIVLVWRGWFFRAIPQRIKGYKGDECYILRCMPQSPPSKSSPSKSSPSKSSASKRARETGKKARSASATPSLAAHSSAALSAELTRRQVELPKLERQAAELRKALAALEARIHSLGGAQSTEPQATTALGGAHGKRATVAKPSKLPVAVRTSPGPRRRDAKPTIGEHIVALLQQRAVVLKPSQITVELARRLSRSPSKNFNIQVSMLLRKLVNSGAIAQRERGEYLAKGPAVVSAP